MAVEVTGEVGRRKAKLRMYEKKTCGSTLICKLIASIILKHWKHLNTDILYLDNNCPIKSWVLKKNSVWETSLWGLEASQRPPRNFQINTSHCPCSWFPRRITREDHVTKDTHLVAGYREIKLELMWKHSLCWLAFILPEGASYASH